MVNNEFVVLLQYGNSTLCSFSSVRTHAWWEGLIQMRYLQCRKHWSSRGGSSPLPTVFGRSVNPNRTKGGQIMSTYKYLSPPTRISKPFYVPVISSRLCICSLYIPQKRVFKRTNLMGWRAKKVHTCRPLSITLSDQSAQVILVMPDLSHTGAVRKLRKHIGVLSCSEKGTFCLFLVLKRGT